LLREFEALSEDNNPKSNTFFSSVRSFWDSMKS
jgi:molecular chaperone DnaJ